MAGVGTGEKYKLKQKKCGYADTEFFSYPTVTRWTVHCKNWMDKTTNWN